MGFVFDKNFIMDPDVDMGKLLSKENKISYITEYKEYEGVEIINPTMDVINYFNDNIKYLPPSTTCSVLRNNHLEVWHQLPNKYTYLTREDVINHLSDKNKICYLSKVVRIKNTSGYLWNIYIYEKSDIQTQRNNKLNQIGI